MDRTKIKNLIITFFVCYLIGACAFNKVIAEDNDTGFSGNILPNAGTTTSNYSNAGFDGVAFPALDSFESSALITSTEQPNSFEITSLSNPLISVS